MRKPIIARVRLTPHERFVVELHGDQLSSWFREHFKGHPKALTRRECRAMFAYTVRDARNR